MKCMGECVGCIGQVALSNQFTAFQTSQKGVLILIVADSLVICKEDVIHMICFHMYDIL